ncbi:MAG: hypothetical protein ACRCZI_08525 [Cetobacterium sp.]
MKTCTLCNLSKDILDFGKRKNPSGNYAPSSRCKECLNLINRENEINACFNWANLYPIVNPKNQEKNNKILNSHILRQQLRLKLFLKNHKNYKSLCITNVESCLPQHYEQSNVCRKCNGFWMVTITRYGKSAAKPQLTEFVATEEGSETRDLLVSQLEMLKV